jgi:hypothetical protein
MSLPLIQWAAPIPHLEGTSADDDLFGDDLDDPGVDG